MGCSKIFLTQKTQTRNYDLLPWQRQRCGL